MFFISMMFLIETVKDISNIYLFLYGIIYDFIMNHIISFFYFVRLKWWNYLWNIFVCLICKFQKSCNLSLEEFFFLNLGVDFKVFVNNSMACLGHGSIFYPPKKTCILVSTLFYLGGVFVVFMQKSSFLWLEFSFLV